MFLSAEDHKTFFELLNGTENCPYEEGEDQDRQTYLNKLEDIQNGNYSHIDAVDMDKVRECVEDTHVWMTNMQNSQDRLTPDQEPAIHSTEIRKKLQALNNICEKNVSKPKPRVSFPMDNNIQPECPHNKNYPEDVTMEYTDFVENDVKCNCVNID